MARRHHARRLNARSRRRNPNPTRRRRRNPFTMSYTRGRHHLRGRRNPIYRLRHRRRHNPLGPVGTDVMHYAGAGIGLAIVQPLVQKLLGGFLPFGTFNSPIITAATGWGLSKLLNGFEFTKKFSHPTLILGLSTAVIQIVQPYVSRALAGATAPAPAPTPTMAGPWSGYRPRGMAGIGLTTGIPPLIVPPPPAPPAAQHPGTNGAMMQGLGMRPGVWGH